MHPLQDQMQDLLNTQVKEGRERGVQLAVYLEGKLIVDAWAGITDAVTKRPVDGQTLFPVFSSTKGPAATVIHRLVERGLLEYDSPLVKYWPEFGAHGKEGITLRHVLSHTAGLYNMPQEIGYTQMCDWGAMCRAMAEEKPLHLPGEEMMYHAVTYSWVVCEAACRVTGKSFPQLLEEEICRPLEMTDLYSGIPDAVESRVAILDEVFEEGKEPTFPENPPPSTVPPWMQPLHVMMNRPDARRACIPASNGIMTARALAKHYAALTPGGVDGVNLVSADILRQTTEIQKPLKNPEMAAVRGLGYAQEGFTPPQGTNMICFGHGGYGGSKGFADTKYRLAVGLTKNFYSPQGAQDLIVRELFAALGIPVNAG